MPLSSNVTTWDGAATPATMREFPKPPTTTWSGSSAAAKSTPSSLAAASLQTAAPCGVSYGPVPGSVYAGHRFVDVFIHGWDLATATGQDLAVDADLMDACRQIVELQLELFRAGALGGEIGVSPGASAQTRFLAWLSSSG